MVFQIEKFLISTTLRMNYGKVRRDAYSNSRQTEGDDRDYAQSAYESLA